MDKNYHWSLKMNMKLLCLALLMTSTGLMAQSEMAESPFTTALREGRASMQLTTLGERYIKIGESIQRATKSNGEVTVDIFRRTKFASQPGCGRLTLVVVQKSTKMVFEKMGVEFNICENGTPPMKMCESNKRLISYDALCPGGIPPVDSPEVAAAIALSIKEGGLTKEQAMAFDQKQGSKAK
jgi:hypothetical protein